jgi:SAM-dependent methyltransferase
MHQRHGGLLRAVGHSSLSEEFNKLKYASESGTFLDLLHGLKPKLRERAKLSALDVGAGTGYWTGLFSNWCREENLNAEMSVLDLSPDALKSIQASYPWVEVIQQDLGSVDVSLLSNAFDLVMAFYCLHHLVRIGPFLNALTFSAKSVRSGGFLMIMDPILTRPFTYLDTLDFASFEGNGIPRHLYLLDDVLSKEGLRRVTLRPVVSFVLNGNIEGDSRGAFLICNSIWKMMQICYRRSAWTKRIGRGVLVLDEVLKNTNLGFSSSLCLYQKGRV